MLRNATGVHRICIVEAAVGRSNCLPWSTEMANFKIFSGRIVDDQAR